MAHSRPLTRLLGSVLSIVIASFALASGVVFATFTDADSDSGTVSAGTIDIRLNTLKGVNEVVWTGVGCTSDNLAPGDVCTANLNVFNIGSLDLWYEVVDLETPCFDVSHTGPQDTNNGGDGNTPGFMPGGGGDLEVIAASVEVVDDPGCMGASALVGIQVNASSSP